MKKIAIFLILLPALCFGIHPGFAQENAESVLTVTGQGRISTPPDRAILLLGALVQAEQAASAQKQVNQIMKGVLKAIQDRGIREERITTVGVSLSPVFAGQLQPAGERPLEPRIVAYRASNMVRVQIDELSRVGDIIDAGVTAGANQFEGPVFELKDDTELRKQALRLAVQEARAKAEAIADAMDAVLTGISEVSETGVTLITPRAEMVRTFAATDRATPVHPGEVRIEAGVTVRYRFEQGE